MHNAFTITNPFAVTFMEFNSDIPEEARNFFSILSLYTDNPEKMSSFSKSLLDRITYHTQIASTEIAFENLKKMHPSLTESDPFALAYMASNPAIPEEEREILKECFRRTVESEQRTLQRFLAERQGTNSGGNAPLRTPRPQAELSSPETPPFNDFTVNGFATVDSPAKLPTSVSPENHPIPTLILRSGIDQKGGVVGEPLVPYNGSVQISDNYIATSSVITNDNVRGYENSDINVTISDN